jgi:extradiol dioxygenase family protein
MIFRIARHTNTIEKIRTFYTEVIGLEVLGSFNDHEGYDGIFLGKKDLDWHLEFTSSDTVAKQIWDEDDFLVFYPKSVEEYESILKNIERQKVHVHVPKNPYWIENGILLRDPDDYGVIVSSLKMTQ